MDLLTLVRRVKQGVKLLDRKIPNWRQIMRKHIDQYEFTSGDHCILGTLEHFSGRMKVLKRRHHVTETFRYAAGRQALGLPKNKAVMHGFDGSDAVFPEGNFSYEQDGEILGQLWRAEFEKA